MYVCAPTSTNYKSAEEEVKVVLKYERRNDVVRLNSVPIFLPFSAAYIQYRSSIRLL